ncbi:MAG: bifunctional protein-disulfide isomerase/oxidoreductase DsbC [Wenzhouxiangellaceae bacterium]
MTNYDSGNHSVSRSFTLLVSAMLWALLASANAQDYPAVSSAMKKLIPTASDIAIADTPIDGLLEVTVGGDIFYVNESGDYLLQGKLFDLDKREDLTERARGKIRKQVLSQVNGDSQIVFAGDRIEHDVTVFTDIDCGYCRKLHSEIEEYNKLGIAIHYMMFPRAGIPSDSYDKAVSVWCAEDQHAALTSAKQGATPKPRQCDNPVREQYETGRDMGMSGTPAIVTKSGYLIPGYMPPADLKARLDQLAAAE